MPRRNWKKAASGNVRALLKMRDVGRSLQKIGDHFGVSRQRIHQILRDHGKRVKVPGGTVSLTQAVQKIGCVPRAY